METTKKLSVLFCFSSLFCLLFTTKQAISESAHMATVCTKSSGNTTRNTTYNTNLKTLLSTLSNQSSFANYYNLTTGLASDTVHGMFLCTGDVNRTTCNACVEKATIEISKNCTNHREAIIYSVDCLVRYSDKFFLSTLETKPSYWWSSGDLIPKSFGNFGQRLSKQMGEVTVRSSLMSSSFTPYYLMDTTRVDEQYDLESIVQCSPHLDPKNCTTCLKLAFQKLTQCCGDKLWAFIFTPKCMVSFDTYTSSLPPLPPPNRSGSLSIRENKKILGGMVLAVAVSVFALMGL
ncbi:PREDICTED: cysteine-rich repeat secretory protein 58-like isoform X2 [Camelina sativa]|uniref:Cysteine-rich repeat secretory protein 58-like isoform X2 n=1 Tax=Camelina sativa TaxID=90675 RepID=A0ABM1QNI6_CAMSA|nr:PREDICTED: cysteine-rich repeat secretory protein 58-like isoform X2 [Camelina sativa]